MYRSINSSAVRSLSDTSSERSDDEKSLVLDSISTQSSNEKIKLNIATKYGETEGEFYVDDLKAIKYFSNQLSGRWNNSHDLHDIHNNTLSICGADLNFSIYELKTLLICKRYSQIPNDYPFENLPRLCCLCDYTTESMDINIFTRYFSERIPAIKASELLLLQSLCVTPDCEILLHSTHKFMERINDSRTKINIMILENWQTASIKVLTSNDFVAASIFVDHIKVICRDKLQSKIEFTSCRNVNDLSVLWNYIKSKKLYLYYPQIMTAIDELQYKHLPSFQTSRNHSNHNHINHGHDQIGHSYNGGTIINEKMGPLLRMIALDVIDIVFLEKNLKFKRARIKWLIYHWFNLIKRQKFETDCATLSYDFLVSIIWKLLKWRESNLNLFNIHCGDINIINLLLDNFDTVSTAIRKRNFLGDIKSINSKLNKAEKSQILQILLNEDFINLMDRKQMMEILKPLIEMDYEESFKLTALWFPVFMNDKYHQNWIVNELPNKNSLNTLELLINGICEYIVSTKYNSNPCNSAYIDFINEYTNNNWKIN